MFEGETCETWPQLVSPSVHFVDIYWKMEINLILCCPVTKVDKYQNITFYNIYVLLVSMKDFIKLYDLLFLVFIYLPEVVVLGF